MKHQLQKLSTAATLLMLCTGAFAQRDWAGYVAGRQPKNKALNLNSIKKAFNDYITNNPRITAVDEHEKEEAEGYAQYYRWTDFWETRVNKDGSFPKNSVVNQKWEDYKTSHPQYFGNNKRIAGTTANWTAKGPFSGIDGYTGVGRINCVAFHPTNANTMWVGTPAGGLWKTTDGGTSWTTTTDNNPVLGVSDMVINPTTPTTIYIATGDGDMGSLSAMLGSSSGDTKSVGVLKSTDGGATWQTTGLSWNTKDGVLIRRLAISPTNPLVLLAATSDGIYKTTDGGSTWTQKQTGYFIDIELKPGDASVCYASNYYNSQIYRSADGGDTWTQVTNFTQTLYRIQLAVSAANPNMVLAIAANTNRGLDGIYKSTDAGATFSLFYDPTKTGGLNLLNNSLDGSGTDGQGEYDLCMAISPTDANMIYVGGVNTWKSTDGGVSWTIATYWNSGGSPTPTVHADKHCMAFAPTNSNMLYQGNDGGIYNYNVTADTWTDLSAGMNISQVYRFSNAATDVNFIIAGLQDNGTQSYAGSTTWKYETGGDGMDCAIDYTNAANYYASYVKGTIYRYTNNNYDARISDNIPNSTGGTGSWITPIAIDPQDANTIWAGFTDVYKSSDRGNSWTQLTSGLSGNAKHLKVAPSNNQVVYLSTYSVLKKTINGGTSWSDISSALQTANPSNFPITYIHIHPTDANKLWITLGGYPGSNGKRVLYSIDGGASWTDISGTLPQVPCNTIVFDKNATNGAIYAGTDVGVYYTDNTMSDWIPYNTGLPNVIVTQLEIQYQANKLRAATFGRGVWESDLYTNSNAPAVANFTQSKTTICQGATISFTSTSSGASSLQWTFSGGTPATSTSKSPVITYSTAGNYGVTLTATGNTTDTKTMNNAVTVNALPNVVFAKFSPDTICKNATPIALVGGSPTGGTYTGSGVSGNQFNATTAGLGIQTITYSYTDANGCSAGATAQLKVVNCTGTTGINGLSSQNIIMITPNPSNGVFQIKLPESATNIESQVIVTAVDGREVFKDIIIGSSQIKMKEPLPGVYFVTVKYEGVDYKQKMMVK